MSGRTDPRRTVDVDPEIGAAHDRRLARMQSDPNPDLSPLRPRLRPKQPLRRHRSRNPVPRPPKHGEQLIGPTVDLLAARLRHRPPKQPPQITQHPAITGPELLHEPR